MGGKHVLQVRRHRVGPEKVMVERVVAVCTLGRVQDQQLVDQIQSVGVFDVSFEAIFHFPLLAFGELHFLVQLVLLVYAGPNLQKTNTINEKRRYLDEQVACFVFPSCHEVV